ncbi:TetR/AcrR family transcriptional regulator [Brevibacterium sp. UCMA 11752]|uniref:TetR/AcrR family transcriptional regulator n=1 Tax=Brevibacterium sp. UCMA 11752 TaxID=2745946 RepID=UPI001F1E2340|nr:TetR/AcrR family transcriptional regulator [Brevibacterium sp. UCMA 11752]MCF2586348.1 TetR/AcrR family transcriptional regulator [Brevibacterium sp. UCMA 11752]
MADQSIRQSQTYKQSPTYLQSPAKQRTRTEERRLNILAAARERADRDGWAAVTTRHLAEAIGYSQPVLYGHFPGGKSEIMRTVALDGFVELTDRCRSVVAGKAEKQSIAAVAHSYLDFADEHPAVYEAMFRQPIEARFAEEGNEEELRDAFDALAVVIGDPISTEVFWGALHGIGLLERAGRMRFEEREKRIDELSARFVG